MIKFLILFSLFLLASCGGGGGGSSSEEKNQAGISNGYYPQGLSEKLITKNSIIHAPMNIIAQELTLTFNASTQTITGHSLMSFKLRNGGRPYFELQGTISNVKIDQVSSGVTAITDPDGQNQSYWSVNKDLSSDTLHEVEFDYTLPVSRVTFTGGGVRFLTDMTDLSGKFFEYWGPCGFEGDAFAMKLTLKVLNGTSSHKLYTNGALKSSTASTWQIEFPEYFSKSSFYVHLTNQVLPSKTFTYKGIAKDIPVEVYGVTEALVNTAVSQLPALFKELEGDYGAYPHEKFLAYMNDRSGGMEYVGATITSVASLDHELLHSWFARSVIPADGRSGWIDEAMASWRDYGYKRATSTLKRTVTNLANYSPFRKTTPSNSYVDGRELMAELDFEFAANGGMKPIMKALHAKYKNNIITNEEFWNFLELYTGQDLTAFQIRYVMGNMASLAGIATKTEAQFSPLNVSKHPTPLTEAEILKLR